MAAAERAAALEAYGFTPRKASFVATVLLHGGVCVPRQYCAFAGITRDKVVHEFFATLTTRRLATVYPFGGKGSHVYHLHHKAERFMAGGAAHGGGNDTSVSSPRRWA